MAKAVPVEVRVTGQCPAAMRYSPPHCANADRWNCDAMTEAMDHPGRTITR